MRLQAGGSLLSPEKYAATPQKRRGQRPGAHYCTNISQASSPRLFGPFLSVYSPPTPTALQLPALIWTRISVPLLLPKNTPFGLFFLLATDCS